MKSNRKNGKYYPYIGNPKGKETSVLVPNESFFDVIFFSLQAAKDSQFWATDKLNVSPLYVQHIPFLGICFPKQRLSFDVSMNMFNLRRTTADKWINTSGNLVSLVLVCSHTQVIHGMRFISVGFEKEWRKECKDQLEFYDNTQQVDNNITSIMKTLSSINDFYHE